MEVSHKVLAILLAVAIVFSVIGTFWNIDRISRLTRLTGYGSTGYVNVTISTTTAINVTATDCAFGAGYINVGNTSALLESNGTIVGWSGAGTATSLGIRNDGNTNITLNVSSGKNLTGFYGAACNVTEGCTYQFWSADNEAGTCTSGLATYPGTTMNGGNKTVCAVMRYSDTQDDLYVHCRLNITQSVPPGAKTDTWTFWAIQL